MNQLGDSPKFLEGTMKPDLLQRKTSLDPVLGELSSEEQRKALHALQLLDDAQRNARCTSAVIEVMNRYIGARLDTQTIGRVVEDVCHCLAQEMDLPYRSVERIFAINVINHPSDPSRLDLNIQYREPLP